MRSDQERLADMLDAIDAIMRHTTAGRAVLDDEVTGAAVMRWVEIIGEAAGRVSPELRTTYQEIPWVGAISMRNRLVPGYFEIDAIEENLVLLVPGAALARAATLIPTGHQLGVDVLLGLPCTIVEALDTTQARAVGALLRYGGVSEVCPQGCIERAGCR